MTVTARCSCGRVELETAGTPITCVACYCDDCQAGARQIEALANAPPVRDSDGGTAYLLYRKDRFRCSRGGELLQAFKIKDTSTTNRIVATCCNSGMFLHFDGGPHWVSVYRSRFLGKAPPLQMRIQTKFLPEAREWPTDTPTYKTYPVKFVGKLVAAKIAMMLGR